MGFLDNSGDIILDAVLTDLGRKRLAEGNFTISKYALGDDEINYTLYNPNHPSGSAYYDLEIIQTPVLESFTNNTSTMKSRLITLSNNNILYLPVLKENNLDQATDRHSSNTYLIAVDQKTQRTGDFNDNSAGVGKLSGGQARVGVLFGQDPTAVPAKISIHQGIDNNQKLTIGSALTEESYIIQIDGRFGTIVDVNGTPQQEVAAMTQDDDGFLFYTVNLNQGIVKDLNQEISPLAGAQGSQLEFKIKASDILTDNQSFFDRFGFSIAAGDSSLGSKACKAIDSTVRITGIKTGYSIDIPVRFIKDVTT